MNATFKLNIKQMKSSIIVMYMLYLMSFRSPHSIPFHPHIYNVQCTLLHISEPIKMLLFN